eukprot:GHVT01070877.1.p1 GENE.GHVT01070877.1~~GHVT01070877.1.p1  ORF type:complete len:222 (-),score=31.21 GHVT01070877.1:172-837(-)
MGRPRSGLSFGSVSAPIHITSLARRVPESRARKQRISMQRFWVFATSAAGVILFGVCAAIVFRTMHGLRASHSSSLALTIAALTSEESNLPRAASAPPSNSNAAAATTLAAAAETTRLAAAWPPSSAELPLQMERSTKLEKVSNMFVKLGCVGLIFVIPLILGAVGVVVDATADERNTIELTISITLLVTSFLGIFAPHAGASGAQLAGKMAGGSYEERQK